MIKLGISAFYHDSAAAIVVNGKVVAAVEEERLRGHTRVQSSGPGLWPDCLERHGHKDRGLSRCDREHQFFEPRILDNVSASPGQ